MSHNGNGEHDFDDLKQLEPEVAEKIKQARIEARDIIDRLEPFHISSWADLLTKLDDCRETAIRNARLLDPTFRKRWEQEQKVEIAKGQRQLKLISSYKKMLITVGVLAGIYVLISIFTNLPLRVGDFVWRVIVPIVMVGISLFIFLVLDFGRFIVRQNKQISNSSIC